MTRSAAPQLTISPADPLDASAAPLLERHRAFTLASSPPGTCYAFDPSRLGAPDISFWIAERAGAVLGCVAVQWRPDALAELKSMHVLEEARGAGAGRALVEHAIKTARERGCTRMGLETGRSDGFAASRRLYQACGFETVSAFAPYKDDTFSHCMMRTL
jgi:putative acetyltransferase